MLIFGKFSVFSLTTLMFVYSVALKTQFLVYCEGEFPNNTSTLCDRSL